MAYEQDLIGNIFALPEAEATESLRSLVDGGENHSVEFKSSWIHDVRANKQTDELKFQVLKGLVGFLNKPGAVLTHPGVVLIGVKDDGGFLGVENDLRYCNKGNVLDGFKQRILNACTDIIKPENGTYIQVNLRVLDVQPEGKRIAVVGCSGVTDGAVWLDPGHNKPKRFYVRQEAKTQSYDADKASSYIRRNLNPRPPSQGTTADANFQKLKSAQASQDIEKIELTMPPAVRDVTGLAQTMEDVAKDIATASQLLRKTAPALNVDDAVVVLKEHPEVVRTEFGGNVLSVPNWLRVVTHRVLGHFLSRLRKQRRNTKKVGPKNKLQTLWVVSPWLSDLQNSTENPELSFDQLLKQVQDDQTTVYVVTRPPESEGHERAVNRWRASGRANIVYLKDLHTKLYIAQLRGGAFALMGSANFTTRSLTRLHELGMLIDDARGGDGARIIKLLKAEAANLYRQDGRQKVCHAKL